MSNQGGFMVVKGRCCRCSRVGDGMAFYEHSREVEIVVCPICLSSAYHHMQAWMEEQIRTVQDEET